MVGTNLLPLLRDQDRHARIARQDFRQQAFPMGRKVGDDDKGHAGVRRHGLEQLFERFNASC
jgi:hypothetical protein